MSAFPSAPSVARHIKYHQETMFNMLGIGSAMTKINVYYKNHLNPKLKVRCSQVTPVRVIPTSS